LERLPTGPDSLWVQLPRPVEQGQGVVSLRFSGALYLVSNAFEVQVGQGQGADQVWQRVDNGVNAGRGLTVFTPFTKAVLGEVAASSNPFTPNGDGINDVVELVFPVFQVQGAKALVLEVYGLDGQSVQRIEQAVATAAGVQRMTWDGRDRQGRLLPPGLYVCRVGVEVDAEGEQTTSTKLVASVY
ncbi:MAG: gliding motility-associated C-terminal domain-containing protein, partial [Gemmatimonadetes bacterium]|nr:gliding motility-associated C-terminal domain-containing protein [Gemmatimonadota bacterium]